MIDTHTHIYLQEFDADRDDVVLRAQEARVQRMILPNVDIETIPRLYASVDQYPNICIPAMGLHPEAVDRENLKNRLSRVRKELDMAPYQFVAIGEVGMDLYWDNTFVEEQKFALCTQIEWAIEKNLPLILHSREAVSQVVACLSRYSSESKLRGVFHSFTGTGGDLSQILGLPSFMIGINGVITFKNSHLAALLPLIPSERIIAETDAPYLSPVPKRGKRNEPSHLPYTVDFMAQILGLDLAHMAEICTSNAARLFSLN